MAHRSSSQARQTSGTPQGTEAGMLGGINAIIVGNYLTTLGRPAQADLEMLSRLRMPIKALSGTL
jgi:biotin synthase